MKKILFFMCFVALFCGCSSEENPKVEEENPLPGEAREYVVNLGMGGEILEIEESPLTKVGGNDMYGVQVYASVNSEDYLPYAYGLFDDKSLMQIKLLDCYSYKFVATMVVDAKRKLDSSYGFSFPFYLNNPDQHSRLENMFKYGNTFFWGLSLGGARMKEGSFDIPNTERYWGEVVGYRPSENGVVSIDMKRVCFGVKVVAEGVTEGVLKINIKDAPEWRMPCDTVSVQDVFTFFNHSGSNSGWTRDGYTETIPVSITWLKPDNMVVPLVTKDITFKRNVLTTIKVVVRDSSLNNGFDIGMESGAMGREDIVVEGGNGTNNGVSPNK